MSVPASHVQRRVSPVVSGLSQPPLSVVLRETLNVAEIVLLDVAVAEAIEQRRELVGGWSRRSGGFGLHGWWDRFGALESSARSKRGRYG